MTDNLNILTGDNRISLRTLPECSVHCAITSPPYWNLRSYLPEGHELKNLELGAESTPELYIANQVRVFREVRRVLRDDGVLFVNLGDSYASEAKNRTVEQATAMCTLQGSTESQRSILNQPSKITAGFKPLDKVGIPERFAIAMQADGWYWRDTIIWAKPAPMPSSVNGWRWERCRVKINGSSRSAENHHANANDGKPHGERAENGKDFASTAGWLDCPGCAKCKDAGGYVLRKGSWRTTTAHEYIFMFTKTESYFCDAAAVREPASSATIDRNKYSRIVDDPDEQYAVVHDHEFEGTTRNPRSVWTIAADGFKGKHYAVFPKELPRRCIDAATPAHGVCAKCGAPWARMVETTRTRGSGSGSGSGRSGNAPAGKNGASLQGGGATGDVRNGPMVEVETIGWRATCACNTEDRVPATVLDPYGGSGTTAEVAISMGRRAILCELNPEYVTIIRKRMSDSYPLLVGAS